jgi:hypothetical protein
MASSPQFKVYDSNGVYQACAKESHAAALLAEHYEGEVRWGHQRVVWTPADPSPLQSFDVVALLIHERCRSTWRAKA